MSLATASLALTTPIQTSASSISSMQESFDVSYDSKKELDNNGDGVTDEWQYFDHGTMVKGERDRNQDGRVDNWIVYNPDGSTRLAGLDENFDGRPELLKYFRHGVLVASKAAQFNADGRADVYGFMGTNGQLEKTAIDFDGDGRAERWVFSEHDKSVFAIVDDDQDGQIDLWVMFDAQGQELHRAVASDRAGEPIIWLMNRDGKTSTDVEDTRFKQFAFRQENLFARPLTDYWAEQLGESLEPRTHARGP